MYASMVCNAFSNAQPRPSTLSAHQSHCWNIELYLKRYWISNLILYLCPRSIFVKHQLQETLTVQQSDRNFPIAKDVNKKYFNPVIPRTLRING